MGQTIEWPYGVSDGYTFNPSDTALNIAEFFGEQPQTHNEQFQNQPTNWGSLKATMMMKRTEDIWVDYNLTQWFYQYFTRNRQRIDWDVAMQSVMKLRRFTAQHAREGAPGQFTTTEINSWYDIATKLKTGVTLKYGFTETQWGIRLYAYYISGMVAAIDNQLRIDFYARMNAEPDRYAVYLDKLHRENPVKALIEIVESFKTVFNVFRETKFWSFQALDNLITSRERDRTTPFTDSWIIDGGDNEFLSLQKENSLNKYTGQYKIDGDGALNKIQGMKGITMLGERPVASQYPIPVTEEETYNGMQGVFEIGHHYVLDNTIHSKPYQHNAGLQTITLQNGWDANLDSLSRKDTTVNIEFEYAANRADALLKDDNARENLYGDVLGNQGFLVNSFKDHPEEVAHAIKFGVDTMHAAMRVKQSMKDTTEEFIWRDDYISGDTVVTSTWVNEFKGLNPGTVTNNTVSLGANNSYTIPITNTALVTSCNDFFLQRLALKYETPTNKDQILKYLPDQSRHHIDYLNGVFAKFKSKLALPPLPLVLKFKNTADGTPLATGLKITDVTDVGLVIHLMLKSGSEFLGIKSSGVFVPTLIPFTLGIADTISLKLDSPFDGSANVPKLETNISNRGGYPNNYPKYQQYAFILWNYLETGSLKNVIAIHKENIATLFGIQISIPNEGVLGSNGVRLSRDGKFMKYTEDDTNIRVVKDDALLQYNVSLEKKLVVNMVDPEQCSWAKCVSAKKPLYGSLIEPVLSKHDRIFWTYERYKEESMARQMKTVKEYVDEPSVLVFFVPPWFTGASLQLLVAQVDNSHWNSIALPDPLKLYTDLLAKTFTVQNYIDSFSAQAPDTVENTQMRRNLVTLPGPCAKIDVTEGMKRVFRRGNGWWTEIGDGIASARFKLGIKDSRATPLK